MFANAQAEAAATTHHMCSAPSVAAHTSTSAHHVARALIVALHAHPTSLQLAVLRLCWRRLALATLHRLVHATAVLAAPVLAYVLLRWLTSDDPDWIGLACTAGIGVCAASAALFRRLSNAAALGAALQARQALCGLAYLRAQQLDWASLSARQVAEAKEPQPGTLSSSGASDMTSAPLGRLSELLGSAADNVVDMMPAMLATLTLPIEVAVALAVLFMITGVASLGGVGLMLFSLACSHAAGVALERLARRKADASSAFHATLGARGSEAFCLFVRAHAGRLVFLRQARRSRACSRSSSPAGPKSSKSGCCKLAALCWRSTGARSASRAPLTPLTTRRAT